jgi:coenzyme PQQ precursor peptide PqqA
MERLCPVPSRNSLGNFPKNPLSPRGPGDKDIPVAASAAQSSRPGIKTMRWEKPQATDFRFGMEITMYIANR